MPLKNKKMVMEDLEALQKLKKMLVTQRHRKTLRNLLRRKDGSEEDQRKKLKNDFILKKTMYILYM